MPAPANGGGLPPPFAGAGTSGYFLLEPLGDLRSGFLAFSLPCLFVLAIRLPPERRATPPPVDAPTGPVPLLGRRAKPLVGHATNCARHAKRPVWRPTGIKGRSKARAIDA